MSTASFVATVGGVGRSPWAPGTVGSAVAVVLYMLALGLSPLVRLAILVGIALLGVWASAQTSAELGVDDPSSVVIDEVCGQWIALIGHVAVGADLPLAFAGFACFRLFDILKPWPVGALERLPGGWGIMADDLAAGVLANLLLAAVRYATMGAGVTGLLSCWF